jgi:hypothetical protein
MLGGMRVPVLFLLLGCFLVAAEPLNFSSRALPRQRLDSKAQAALGAISSGAAAAAVLDRPCVVDQPGADLFVAGDLRQRRASMNDTSDTMMAKLRRNEAQQRAAKAKAERLWRALWRSSPEVPSEGMAAQKQVPTSLRRVLWLATHPASGVRPEAQVWLRRDARLQAAFGAIFAAPRRLADEAPRSEAGAAFAAARPALDFVLNLSDERPSEDGLRALDAFVGRYSAGGG